MVLVFWNTALLTHLVSLKRNFRAGVRVKTLTEPGREDGNSFSKGKEYDINRYDGKCFKNK